MVKAIIILIAIILAIPAFAETILLKSGKSVEGKITERTDKYIKLDFEGVSLTYFLDEIEKIDGKLLVSAKEPALDLSPSQDMDGMLDREYTDFGIFKIRLPRQMRFSQKTENRITQVTVKKPGTLNGFIISYILSNHQPADIFQAETMKKIENGNSSFLQKYTSLINRPAVKTLFQDMPALRFDSEAPDQDLRLTKTYFIKDGHAFTLLTSTVISQFDLYNNLINSSLNTIQWAVNYKDQYQTGQQDNKFKVIGYILAFLCAPLCYFLARSKNRSWPVMWGVFGFILPLIIVVILLLMPKRQGRKALEAESKI